MTLDQGWTNKAVGKVTEVKVIKTRELRYWMAHHFTGPEIPKMREGDGVQKTDTGIDVGEQQRSW